MISLGISIPMLSRPSGGGGGGGVVTSGLVMHLDAGNAASYPGSGTTWNDLSGNGNNATLVNAPSWNAGGWFTWNGTNQRATVNRMVQNSFSLECWFQTTSTAGTAGNDWYLGNGLIDAEAAGVVDDFGLSIGNGEVLFGVRSIGDTIRHSAPYNSGSWVQIIATRNQTNGAVAILANGIQVASGTFSTNTLNASTIISIAALATNINFFAGNIAIARIYNIPFTATQAAQNFNANRGRFGL